MEVARTGDHINVEITAHEATNGARHENDDVSINVISTEVGRILVSPPAGEPRRPRRELGFRPRRTRSR